MSEMELTLQLQTAIMQLQQVVAELREEVSALKRQQEPPSALLTKQEAADLLGVSPRTVEAYKRGWVSGAHFFPQAKGDRYNRELLEDWLINRDNPQQHQRAVELWLKRNSKQRKR